MKQEYYFDPNEDENEGTDHLASDQEDDEEDIDEEYYEEIDSELDLDEIDDDSMYEEDLELFEEDETGESEKTETRKDIWSNMDWDKD